MNTAARNVRAQAYLDWSKVRRFQRRLDYIVLMACAVSFVYALIQRGAP